MTDQKRIRVLFITKWYMNRYDPQLGVFIRKHASAAALYCDVRLLCVLPDPNQKNLMEFESEKKHQVDSLVVYFRKFSSSFSILNRVVNFFRFIYAARAGMKRIKLQHGNHDLTHAYIMLRPVLVAWWLKFFHGIPFVISEQWSGYATGKFNAKGSLVKFLYRWFFARAGGVTAVSEFLKSKMISAGLKNNYVVTPNIVEPVPANNPVLRGINRTKILTVADLVDSIKNISDTIRVVSELVNSGSNIEFHIIGHGPDEAMLKQLAGMDLIDKYVFFHGVKSNEEVYQFLHSCDLLVMNSRFETFSLVCIEAMSCGKPVIATRCGGPEEFLTVENGILIGTDSPDELKGAINKILSGEARFDPEKLKTFAINNFSSEKCGILFHHLYRSIIQNNS